MDERHVFKIVQNQSLLLVLALAIMLGKGLGLL